ncbi:PDDEXK nuclease domain-containing protein [Desulfobotulus sp.]|uniref:PDDEXK nuclease domain-containing protein n=1 Tax=Desulfobotulus sp. TaxID=1940337 RepID=UPI002A366BF9|nr:PDDEXK nuclease domain-containing protein [Desulfobotulus sp.]MDY0162789.1 PDDEXK nuclease domain-containing protein [Desulfobotulus sp.]
MTHADPPAVPVDRLYQDIRHLIESARSQIVTQVNQALVFTYWQIGKTITTEVINDGRAQYGTAVLKHLAARLTQEYGTGFSYSSLTRMAKFFSAFPEQETVATLSQQLSWSHFVEIIRIEDAIKRAFYIRMATDGRWSVRTLRERMDGMLFERTAISRQPEALIQQELAQLQQKPENAILMELERFLLELGSDFAFMGRQKRIQIGGNDYYLDLLFYHRKLKRLVLIELKLGDFKPEYKGQVELYLKWLAKYEQQADEHSPIAIILCSGKDTEVVELMDLEPDNIHIGEYWLKLPPKKLLQAKLHKAMAEARARLDLLHERGREV